MKKLLIGLGGLAFLTGCSVSSSKVDRLMKQEGVTQYTNTGYAFWGCGKDDSFHSGFRGTKNGQPVSGVICGGWMKGYTIRYN